MADRDELITKYLEGQLTPEQEKKFPELVKTDPAFRKEVEFHEYSIKYIHRTEKERIQNLAKKEIETLKAQGKISDRYQTHQKRRRILYIAASIAALFLLSLVAYNIFIPVDKDKSYTVLADSYDRDFRENLVNTKNGNPSDESLFTLNYAINLYIQDSCSKSLPLLQSVFSSPQYKHLALFYAGLCERKNSPSIALPYFQQASKLNTNIEKLTNQYIAISFLRLDPPRPDSAKVFLQKIINNPSYRQSEQNQAAKFLNELEKY